MEVLRRELLVELAVVLLASAQQHLQRQPQRPRHLQQPSMQNLTPLFPNLSRQTPVRRPRLPLQPRRTARALVRSQAPTALRALAPLPRARLPHSQRQVAAAGVLLGALEGAPRAAGGAAARRAAVGSPGRAGGAGGASRRRSWASTGATGKTPALPPICSPALTTG